MSNNFLVRQIFKTGSNFFVGASIAIATLCPIVLTSSRVLASYYQLGIPGDAVNQLQTLSNQRITPKTIAFTPDGGWVILNGNGSNGYSYHNLRQDAIDVLATLYKQKSTINTIAFTPKGEWVIIFDGYGSFRSANFPQDALNALDTLYKQKSTIKSVAFTPKGEWVIIFDGNGYLPSVNFPQDALDAIVTRNKEKSTIKSVAFDPNGSWVILYDINGHNAYSSKGLSSAAASTLKNNLEGNTYTYINIAFTPSNGWVLLYYTLGEAPNTIVPQFNPSIPIGGGGAIRCANTTSICN